MSRAVTPCRGQARDSGATRRRYFSPAQNCFVLFRGRSAGAPQDRGREDIAGATDGLDESRCAPVQLELTAQSCDENIDASIEVIPTTVVHRLQELFATEDTPGLCDELA